MIHFLSNLTGNSEWVVEGVRVKVGWTFHLALHKIRFWERIFLALYQ